MLVYLLFNEVNSKAYVGQTSGNDLVGRWNTKFTNVKGNPHFDAALKKYGPESFSRQVLNHCSSRQETDNLERLWIALLRTHDPEHGYNMQMGGMKWRGDHTEETRQKIGQAVKRMWQSKSEEEMNRHAEKARQSTTRIWEAKTAQERKAFGQKVSKALRGRKTGTPSWNWSLLPAPNRGVPRPPHTEEAKVKISEGLKRHYAQKRDLNQRKPPVGTKYQPPENNAANRKEPRFTSTANGRGANGHGATAMVRMPRPRTRQQFVLLCEQAVKAIELAYASLEHGGTVTDAQQRLKEVSRRLSELEQEYRACNW